MNAPGAVGHPSPHRLKVGWLRMTIILFGGPAAWIAQILISHPLVSYGCFPHAVPLDAPLWRFLPHLLGALSLVCLVAATLSALLAFLTWHRTKRELEGDHEHVLETGEGRTRFLVLVGFLVSGGFMVAIVFTASALLFVSPC